MNERRAWRAAVGWVLGLLVVTVVTGLVAGVALAQEPVELTVMTWMYQSNSPQWVESPRLSKRSTRTSGLR